MKILNTDRVKKTVLNFLFWPIDLNVSHFQPDEVLQLSEDSSLYDPMNNSSAQQGDPEILIYHNVTIWPAQSIAFQNGSIAFNTFLDEEHIKTIGNLDALRRYPRFNHHGWATTIECVYPTSNYYHFFIDVLPRIWALRHPALRELPISMFLTRSLRDEEMRILKDLLPNNVIIRKTHRFTRVKTDHYIHLPYLSKDRVAYNCEQYVTSGGFIPMEYLNFFQSYMIERYKLGSYKVPQGKIFVTRQNASIRRLTNEGEVRHFLEQRGFEIIALEEHSLAEQIDIFRSSRIVITQHGAALTNLLYMREGVVLEIFSSQHNPQYYSQFAHTLGLDYHAIHLDGVNKHSDVHLPLSLLNEALMKITKETK